MEKTISALLVKIEGTLGTDAVPVEGTDAIEIHGQPTFDPVTQVKPRNVPIPTFGELAPYVVGESYKLGSVKIPLKGSGTAGTDPRLDPILRGMGLTKTTSAGVSVAYDPHSSFDGESFTCYFWLGGARHKMLGCIVSSAKISLQAGELMYLDIEITGLYGGTISDTAFPSPTFESTTPQVWDNANFVVSVDSTPVSLVTSKFEIDFGLEVAARKDPNSVYGISRYFIKDRKLKINFDPEKEDLADFNPYAIHEAQTLLDFETKPAGTAGNLIEITVNDVSLDAPKAGDRENAITWELSGQSRPTVAAGNAEINITFK